MTGAHRTESAADSGHWSWAQRVRGVIGACAGNLVEWFDFYVYSYTSIYFAAAFFPSGDQVSQLLSTAIVFAVGFFMRPLGGWIFGRLADRKGRRYAMMLSVSLMCGGSLLLSLLPTYASVGILAPIALVLVRMLQGLSVGAEYGTGATYLSEVGSKGRRGFLGSFQYVTLVGGQLIATLVLVILEQVFTGPEMRAFGWRIPFFIGALGGLVVLYLRRTMQETATKSSMERKEAGSVLAMWRSHKRAVIVITLFTCGGSLYFYTFTNYMQKLLVLSGDMPTPTVTLIMTAALLCFTLMQPLMGLLCDRLGTRAHMLIFTGLAATVSVPLLYMLEAVTSPVAAFALVLLGLTINAFYTAIAGFVKADMFPIEVRALGVGLPYAVGNALFGGTAESVALTLRQMGQPETFFYYVAGISALAFLASLCMPDLKKHGYLDGDGKVEENIPPFRPRQAD
jgi:MHS family dicarboxylic acid transporter PcaT-like MFS transporter